MEQGKVQSRVEKHQNTKPKSENGKEKKKAKPKNKSFHRTALFLMGLAVLSLVIGGMIGLSVGDQSPLEVFNFDTWTHMVDLIFST